MDYLDFDQICKLLPKYDYVRFFRNGDLVRLITAKNTVPLTTMQLKTLAAWLLRPYNAYGRNKTILDFGDGYFDLVSRVFIEKADYRDNKYDELTEISYNFYLKSFEKWQELYGLYPNRVSKAFVPFCHFLKPIYCYSKDRSLLKHHVLQLPDNYAAAWERIALYAYNMSDRPYEPVVPKISRKPGVIELDFLKPTNCLVYLVKPNTNITIEMNIS